MIFNSYIFIFLFLPATLLVFRIAGKKFGYKSSVGVLCIASFFYYAWWNPPYLILLFASILFNFYHAKVIAKSGRKKIQLFVGISVNLFLLGYFKYAGFLVSNLNSIFNQSYNLGEILLPIGISFFTFQQIAYLSDVTKEGGSNYGFREYVLFVTFFPQLIAGPIVHHKEMMPQFQNKAKDTDINFALGITLFIIGLSKKVILADNLAPHASQIFDHAGNGVLFNVFEAWIACFAYTFQLYFDFSGYSDMALGVAAMFGIFLPVNFLSPYKATSLIDFWRRWHITLSRFLKVYLYIPLGGNRKGRARELANLLITMAIGGLWHGANWTFVAWGILHGIGLSINHLVSKLVAIKIPKLLGGFVTFIFVSLCWVLFRAESFDAALFIFSTMFCTDGLMLPIEMRNTFQLDQATYAGEFHKTPIAWIIFSGLVAFLAPNSMQIINSSKFSSTYYLPITRFIWKPTKLWLVITIILFIGCLFNMSGLSEFLYYQF